MSDNLRVRRAVTTDAALLRAIRLEALRDTPEAYGDTYAASSAQSGREWRRLIATRLYFLGELDGAVRGMASGGVNDARPGTYWLFGLYVSPEARGSGLANALVERVSDWSRSMGSSELYLHVTETLARSRAFYEKMGFVPTGDTITMHRDPSIRLITMVRSLG